MKEILYNYIGGIVAAFTPCVIILIPLVLYKFFNKEKKQYKEFLIFITGFILAYSIFAIILQNLLTSNIQNGIKIGFGIIFITLGILSLKNRINPLNLPIIKNSFFLGIFYSLIISASPCTIPYLGIILTLSLKNIIINIIFFGLGLITPAVIFAIIGQSILNISKKTGKIYHHFKKLMDILLIFSGVYMIFNITSFSHIDLIPSLILMSFSYFILLKSAIDFKKINIKKIILLLSLLGILIATTIQCNHTINETQKENSFNFFETESQGCESVKECEICKKCSTIFLVSSSIGLLTIILSNFRN